MPRQTKQTQARRRLPQQIDLFAGEPKTPIFALGHKRLEPFHRPLPTHAIACLPHEVEHLTEANGIDRQQQKKHKKRSNVTGESAKRHEKHIADHVRNAERYHRPCQQRGDKEDCPDQGTYIGSGDVGEEDFQKTIGDRYVMWSGVEAELYDNFRPKNSDRAAL
jgi:hypothetical protein